MPKHSMKSFAVVIAILLAAGVSHAQLNGNHVKGDVGLDSGSQAPPGIYWGLGYIRYDTDRINDRSGKQVNTSGSVTVQGGFPLISIVSRKTILGGHYGFTVIPAAVLTNTLDAPRFNQSKSTGAGFGDIYFQPASLGWHFNAADVNTGFGIYAPTGRYKAGNPDGDNTGLGMWGFEPSLGTTVHLNSSKTLNASALLSFEFHTDKRDSSQHVGNILTMEGGLGQAFLKGAAKAGVAYYAQWKLGEDNLTGLPALLVTGKNRVAGLGPELTLPLASKSTLFGFATIRYQFEVYARTTTQGNALMVTGVFPLKPIDLRPPAPPTPPSLTCSADPSSVLAGETARLSAQGVSSTGAMVSYAWTAAGGRIEGSGAVVQMNTTGLAPGNYTATVRASESATLFSECTAQVTVRTPPPAPMPPTASCTVDRNRVQVGEVANLTVQAASPDGHPLTYQWTTTAGTFAGTGATVRLDTTGVRPGAITATARVTDDRNLSASCTSTVTVEAPPPPPPAPQAMMLDTCQFTLNSARVDNVCKAKLDGIALRLQSESDASLVIVGSAESSERNSQQLSQTRADNIRAYLSSDKGIAEGRLTSRTGAAGSGVTARKADMTLVPRGATF